MTRQQLINRFNEITTSGLRIRYLKLPKNEWKSLYSSLPKEKICFPGIIFTNKKGIEYEVKKYGN